jgi:hypothetical protein
VTSIPRWVPFNRAITIWWPFTEEPTTYIPRARFKSQDRYKRTQVHEAVHVRQWKRLGRMGFLRRYLFDRRERLHLEAEAFAASVWYCVTSEEAYTKGADPKSPEGRHNAEIEEIWRTHYARVLFRQYRLKLRFSEVYRVLHSYMVRAG